MTGDFEIQQLSSRVRELEDKVEFLLRHLGVEYIRPSSENDQKILDVLKTGNKIEAIKLYREIYGSDLAGAKRAVEELEAAHPY